MCSLKFTTGYKQISRQISKLHSNCCWIHRITVTFEHRTSLASKSHCVRNPTWTQTHAGLEMSPVQLGFVTVSLYNQHKRLKRRTALLDVVPKLFTVDYEVVLPSGIKLAQKFVLVFLILPSSDPDGSNISTLHSLWNSEHIKFQFRILCLPTATVKTKVKKVKYIEIKQSKVVPVLN
jgi:hypothetical protein